MQTIHATLKTHHRAMLKAHIVPVVIEIMMAHPETVSGEAFYSVVN